MVTQGSITKNPSTYFYYVCTRHVMCMMIYVYHRDKSPIENRFDYNNGQVRMLVTFYDRIFVTLSSDNYTGHKKKEKILFITVNRIYYVIETRDEAAGLFK